jgi:hypothetical protein
MIITTRNDLGFLYNEHYKTGLGVEVGVQNGFNLKQICSQWKGFAYGVDIWPDHEIYENAKRNLEGYNFQLIRATSVIAAQSFKDESIDWVYIDAGHLFKEVESDYNAWFPKVRKGGIISFHDYGINDCIGVKTFIDQLGIPFNLTTDDFWEGVEYQTAWFTKN